jgi:hypothetical protein
VLFVDNKNNILWGVISAFIGALNLVFIYFASFGSVYGRAAVHIFITYLALVVVYFKLIKPSYVSKLEAKNKQIRELENKIKDTYLQTSLRLRMACDNLQIAINRIERHLDIPETKGNIFNQHITYKD